MKSFRRVARRWGIGARKTPSPAADPLLEGLSGYDSETAQVMRRVLKEDSACVDVGAHGGEIFQRMHALAPHATHYAFEPIPALADSLRRRFPYARVCECALSDADGEAEFLHVVNQPGQSGLRPHIYDIPDPAVERFRVRTMRLDSAIPADIRPAFIKIDVEGAELDVMKGGAALIRRVRPFIVFEAGWKSSPAYGAAPRAIHGYVTGDLGLRLTTMARWLHGEEGLSGAEFIHVFEKGLDYYFLAHP